MAIEREFKVVAKTLKETETPSKYYVSTASHYPELITLHFTSSKGRNRSKRNYLFPEDASFNFKDFKEGSVLLKVHFGRCQNLIGAISSTTAQTFCQ